jgi:glycosyltransferase involved in cell wall biosynthesis
MIKIKKLPKVSIIIPTFNNEKTIKKTIETIINQTYQNIEIIVSDNGSTDNTINIIKNFKKNIKIIFFLKKKGMYNLESSYSLGTGKYTAVYHSDDIYEKTIIRKQVEYLEKNHSVNIVFTKAYQINDEDNIIRKLSYNLSSFTINSQTELFKNILKNYNFIHCPTALFRTRNLKNLRWDIKKFNTSSDLNLWFKLLKKGKIHILPEFLASIRISNRQITEAERISTVDSDFIKVMKFYYNKKNILTSLDKIDVKLFYTLIFRDKIRIILNLLKNKKVKDSEQLINKINTYKVFKQYNNTLRYFYTFINLALLKIFFIIRKYFIIRFNV